MKNLIQKAALVLGVALIALSACKKEDMKRAMNSAEETEMNALVEQAGADMLMTDAGNENPEFGVARVDEGIAADFLATATDMDETEGPAGIDDRRDLRAFVRNHSFISCLRKLELSDRQIAAVKKSIVVYEDCRESAAKRARAIHKALVEKYQDKFERLRLAFKNGNITEEQFKAGVHRLRKAFNEELRSLQLQEKLDAAFKKCYREFLGHLKNILTEEQWKAFVNCHRR